MTFAPPADALTITFAQPAALINLNVQEHWGPRSRKVKAWRTAAFLAVHASTSRRHPLRLAVTPCWVHVSFPVPDRRKRDPHNYTPKALIDGLVDAGLWPDDNGAWVTTIEPELRLDPGGPVVVTIWPREAQP